MENREIDELIERFEIFEDNEGLRYNIEAYETDLPLNMQKLKEILKEAKIQIIKECQEKLKKEIMEIRKEDYGDYSKNKICSCGSHKLSHDPHYIKDKEVCDIIDKLTGEKLSK